MNPSQITLANFQCLWPEIIVLLGAMLVLALDVPLRKQKSKIVVACTTALTLLAALLVLGLNWKSSPTTDPFPGMIRVDGISSVANLTLLLIGLMTLAIGHRIGEKIGLVFAEYFALLLFAVAGMMVFASSANLILAFVSLETFSLAMYVLAGFDRRNKANREAALKYFLIGAMAAGFLLFGIAVIYGASGTVKLDELASVASTLKLGDPRFALLLAGSGLALVGLGFKVGLAPFHLWVPDAYQGAPTPVSAFLSAGAKVAGFALIIRLCVAIPSQGEAFTVVLSTLAILTMTLGNLGAIRQTNLKRLMAYSSIAHSGYALVALVGGSAMAASAVMNYVFVYAFMNFCAFGLIIALEQGSVATRQGASMELSDLQGIGFERPLYSVCLAICMFSMAGIPPSAGFVAKLDVFKAALDAHQVALVVVAVINSVISAAVYLRIVTALYLKPKTDTSASPSLDGILMVGVVLCAILMIVWGVLPGSLLGLTSF